MSRTIFLSICAAAYLCPGNAAEQATYHKTHWQVIEGRKLKLLPVDLTFSEQRMTIVKPAKKKTPATQLEIPYQSIGSMSYEMAQRHRVAEGAALMVASLGAGAVLMTTKTKSHWLAIEYKTDAGPQTAILQLHKSEYGSVVQTVESRTGKKVALPDKSQSTINPTKTSRNTDELVRYPLDRVRLALKPAMEKYGCQVKEEKPDRIVRQRVKGYSEATGKGGEKAPRR